ncbi:hypothetical protein Sjap_021647 [Stephania japonica]|uniref:Leucine-rich repeat-containing N-terminal plant-type domain-containing protein n=1 Tax=Stephania japonica TaxID=461633 RepID=A0AAP0HUA9_9MAGN
MEYHIHNCCFFFFIISLMLLPWHIRSSSSSSSPLIPFSNTSSCRRDQSLALLQFKASINHWPSYHPKFASWKVTTDCCTSWDGVTCDDFGFVIRLDVSESFYDASIDSNSSLFSLHHLKALNLAGNSFLNISFPTLVAKLCSLTYFNLSHTYILGHIPSEISQLNNLTSLDLSYSFHYDEVVPLEFSKLTNLISLRLSRLTLESPIALRTLIYNFSSLEELYLDATPTDYKRGGIAQDWFEAVASVRTSLRVLSMSDMGLSGPMGYSILHFSSLSQLYLSGNNITHFPPEMFQLPNLEILDLSWNHHLTLSSLDFPPNKQYALQQLIVRGINFPGRSLPHSIGNLNLLTKFDASNCDLTGPISSSLSKLSQLSQLEELDLWYNAFVGTLSSFAWSKLSSLRMLDLSGNQLTGTIPSSLSKLSQLEELDLGNNAFVGNLSSIAWSNLSSLRMLDLSGNQLTGTIPSSLSKLSQLEELDLGNNAFVGSLSSFAWSNLSSLRKLDLSDNQLTGTIPSSLFSLPSLEIIDLCNNTLEGRIPSSFSELSNLETLKLCSNNFHGMVDPRMFKNLASIDLSDNILLSIDTSDLALSLPHLDEFGFSSCNLSEFPRFLKYQENPFELDLSNNQIQGKVPEWIWNKVRTLRLANNSLVGFEDPVSNHSSSNLRALDLSNNNFEGSIPFVYGTSLSAISLSNNKFTGEIPSYFCNTHLAIVDFSKNQISGRIPPCLSEVEFVYLHENKLQGSIPDTFQDGCRLRVLALGGNQLEGKLPRSLANCSFLQVLDVGENQISDTFPFWLESLSHLQALLLRSNRFHGSIEQHQYHQPNSSFLRLHIIDLSSNNFKGRLPIEYFRLLKQMTVEGSIVKSPKFINADGISLMIPLMIRNKGQELGYLPTQISYVSCIDLSSNQFSGEIAEVIGDLRSLNVLNFSHNGISGEIPSSFQNLRDLQSLDLSNNDLSGEIPSELASITFLEVLNVSCNHLVGRIPSGTQFDTFNGSSFEGNLGLCGSQLQIECDPKQNGNNGAPSISSQEDSSDTNFNWMFVVAGYGSGLIVGFVIERYIFSRNMYYLEKIMNMIRFFQGNRSLRTQRGRRRN